MSRIEAASNAGFNAIECQFPYDYDALEISQSLKKYNLQMVLHNLPAGEWEKGDRGIACDPNRIEEFEQGVIQATTYATILGVNQLNCLAGRLPEGIDAEIAERTFVSNLIFASAQLKSFNIKLLIEPINTYDVPGFFLNTSKYGFELIKRTGSTNIFLQYDAYHMYRMGDPIAETIWNNLARIAHIQIADYPGRGEPGTGKINFHRFLPLLDQINYAGWVGCEYIPSGDTISGFKWMEG